MRNGKRSLAFGIIIGIFLVVGFVNSSNVSAGCAGDCMTCHPKIKDDKMHQILKTCVECHNPAKEKITSLYSAHPEGCGGNCFECHDKWPKDSHHVELDSCNKCHK